MSTRLTGFQNILWFSARDIDLMMSGPKPVRPQVLTIKDVANEFVRLIQPAQAENKGFKPEEYFASNLSKTPLGPTLFVFDNFETISDPVEFYRWLDCNIRPPNKCLITTRNRLFKGDYPIDVKGMTDPECEQLILSTAGRFGVRELLTTDYKQSIIQESGGHPYVLKILIGEIAKRRCLGNVERIIADSDHILTALFERTFVTLSPVAQRVFLTLCGWHSAVPMIALEAVLISARNERMEIHEAIDELQRSSFIDLIETGSETEQFITMPLVAYAFGRPKLRVSAWRSSIEADIAVLRQFGASQPSSACNGVDARIKQLVKNISNDISKGRTRISEHLPLLEFIARRHNRTWLLIAELHLEGDTDDLALTGAQGAIEHYLEAQETDWTGWKLLSEIHAIRRDTGGECHALAQMAECPNVPFLEISNAAAKFAHLFSQSKDLFERDEKRILVGRLAKAMDSRALEGDATDRSRLAWLYLHMKVEPQARNHVQAGLDLDSHNQHCIKLAERLDMQHSGKSSQSHSSTLTIEDD